MLDNIRASLEDFKQFNNFDLIEDKIKFILNYAILAPSTHNSQPWLFKIVDNSCEIYKNPEKQLPEADVDGRDLYISLGCCIENLEIAASYFGIYKKTMYAGKNDNNLVATVFFEEKHVEFKEQYAKLLKAIVYRMNVRGLFIKKNLEPALLNLLRKINTDDELKISLITDKVKLKKIAELTAKGLRIAHSNQNFKNEMSRWVNNNFSKRKEGIPGYSLRMPNLFSIVFPFLVRKFNMGTKLSGLNYLSMLSSPVICIISSKDDNPKVWLKVGQLSEKLMLKSYDLGLRTSIFVASIEIDDLYKEIQKLLDLSERPQFVFCIGYMKQNQKYTPRLPLQDKLL